MISQDSSHTRACVALEHEKPQAARERRSCCCSKSRLRSAARCIDIRQKQLVHHGTPLIDSDHCFIFSDGITDGDAVSFYGVPKMNQWQIMLQFQQQQKQQLQQLKAAMGKGGKSTKAGG